MSRATILVNECDIRKECVKTATCLSVTSRTFEQEGGADVKRGSSDGGGVFAEARWH